MAASFGKMPTTSDLRLISPLRRSRGFAGNLRPGYHTYGYRARTDTAGGLQSFRDGAQVDQADLLTPGGPLVWDQGFYYESIRASSFGGTSVVGQVQSTIYAPAALTDAEMAAIKAIGTPCAP
jgi:hypothetical protein